MPLRPNIEEILKSVDGIQPARPKPFFTGRVMQRIRSEELDRLSFMTPRFRLAVVAVFLLIALNIMLFINGLRSEIPALTEWKNSTPDWVVDYTDNPASTIAPIPNK